VHQLRHGAVCVIVLSIRQASHHPHRPSRERIPVVKTLRAKFEILFESWWHKYTHGASHRGAAQRARVWLCSLIRKERQGVFIKLSLIIGAVDLWMSECVCVWNKTEPRSTQMRVFEVRAQKRKQLAINSSSGGRGRDCIFVAFFSLLVTWLAKSEWAGSASSYLQLLLMPFLCQQTMEGLRKEFSANALAWTFFIVFHSPVLSAWKV
jgi:hypothetical protein